MRILMVTPYAPLRDGIAAYAVQQVGALRAEGHDVEVLSPGPSAAHHHLDFTGLRGIGALAKRVRAYDKVIIQFHPDLFYPHPTTPDRHARSLPRCSRWPRRRATSRSSCTRSTTGSAGARAWIPLLPRLSGVRSTRSCCTPPPSATTSSRRSGSSPTGSRSGPRRVVRQAHQGRPGDGAPDAGHRTGCASSSSPIGFIQPHKGFDRAVRAFTGLADHGCELHVVGSIRVDDADFASYLGELEGWSRRRRAPRCTRASSVTSCSTAGSSPPMWWCCPTATSGAPASSSGPCSTTGGCWSPPSVPWPTRSATARWSRWSTATPS